MGHHGVLELLTDNNRLDSLISRVLLREGDYMLPGFEEVLNPPVGFVVSFMHIHKRGLALPSHPFLVKLLYYYKIQLYHLNPNRVQYMDAFVALCEGYLAMSPHFHLWCYFFSTE